MNIFQDYLTGAWKGFKIDSALSFVKKKNHNIFAIDVLQNIKITGTIYTLAPLLPRP